MTLFGNDPVYRRFLALHPGIWPEVGVLEDAPLLRALRRDRFSLGLPFDRWILPRRVRRVRKAAS